MKEKVELLLYDSIITKMTFDLLAFIEWLKGKKTIIILFAIALVAFLQGMGWLTLEVADMLYKILTPLAGAAFAAKVNRVGFGNSPSVLGG